MRQRATARSKPKRPGSGRGCGSGDSGISKFEPSLRAKRSNPCMSLKKNGLLRRFAPRSDGKCEEVLMAWYVYVVWLFAGALLANAIPHTVQGICGNRFQTPFASPRGAGESSAIVNVIWGFGNL